MITLVDGFISHLKAKASVSDTLLLIPRADAIALNTVGVGNHIYLTLRDRNRYELVRYDHTENWSMSDPTNVMLPVTRDARGLGAKSFPYGACLKAEINSLYIAEMMHAMSVLQSCNSREVPAPTSTSCTIPTSVIGGTTSLMGKPKGMLEFCPGKLIPYYDAPEE